MSHRKPKSYFLEKFHSLILRDPSGCWLWQGMVNASGYGRFYPGGGRGVEKMYAHRYAYELAKGPVPEGLDVDHLCRIRNCVNPDHLEAVTHRENMLRGDTFAARNAAKTHCPRGHLLVRVGAHGGRECVECNTHGTPNGERTACKHGHPFTPENTYYEPSGKGRACRTCRRNRNRAAQSRTTAA